VDEPVLAAGTEDCVSADDALPVERGDHLVVPPLVGLVNVAIPDGGLGCVFVDRGVDLYVKSERA
jgi:hypothetical protein